MTLLPGWDSSEFVRAARRDLKLANILVTKPGIKLLDFCLAKFGLMAEPLEDATRGVIRTPPLAPQSLRRPARRNLAAKISLISKRGPPKTPVVKQSPRRVA
jgi:serine/threonine protein kinase